MNTLIKEWKYIEKEGEDIATQLAKELLVENLACTIFRSISNLLHFQRLSQLIVLLFYNNYFNWSEKITFAWDLRCGGIL